ncbi:MAG TPA: nucleotidyltransferase family protein [Bryobacteraceae bacterium]|nr:nucleotidyltransferase family protein [Bryobacteraceae bacterium]
MQTLCAHAVLPESTERENSAGEWDLLLRCVRQNFKSGSSSLNPVPAAFKWAHLLELAQRHQVITFVDAALRDLDWVPSQVHGWLAVWRRTIVAHNLSLASELSAVLEALRLCGIAAMPFKGPAWTKVLYGSLAARHIADLDLFVKRSDVGRASKVLRDRGYVLLKSLEGTQLDDCKDLGFCQPGTGIQLELHWSACEASLDARLARATLWRPESKSPPERGEIPLPSPARMFLLLAIHGFRHRWSSLKWVCDIAAFVHVFTDLDWNCVLCEAGKLGRKRLVLLSLCMAERLLQVDLPQPVASAIASDPILAAVAAELQRRYYIDHVDTLNSEPVSDRVFVEWFRVQMRDSSVERFGLHSKFILALILPNDNDRVLGHGRLPEPFYWLGRPVRLLRQYGLARFLTRGLQFFVRSTPHEQL